MSDIHIHSQLEHSLRKSTAQLIPLQDKLEILRTGMEETQKYELLTTNQYKQMALVVDILKDI
jgi:hypothetical protein